MAKGQGTAIRACLAICFAILCTLALTQPTLAATYSVGGSRGWTFNVNNWPRTHSFRAGDYLVFNYARNMHNVIQVDKRSYDRCNMQGRRRVYQTGRDKFRLRKGHNYFICTFPGHCRSGMKIDVYAA